jgi:transporter family protein
LGLANSVAAYFFYLKAVTVNDLSVIGPLDNLRPLLVILLSFVILGQPPTLVLILATLLIVAGAFVIQQQKSLKATLKYFIHERRSQLILVSTALFALQGILDKLTLHYISPVTYALLGMVGMCLVYGIGYWKSKTRMALTSIASVPLLICGLLMAMGTLGIMTALKLATPNQVVPLQMTRSFYLSVLGFVFLKETGVIRKLMAGAVMFAGVVLLLSSP